MVRSRRDDALGLEGVDEAIVRAVTAAMVFPEEEVCGLLFGKVFFSSMENIAEDRTAAFEVSGEEVHETLRGMDEYLLARRKFVGKSLDAKPVRIFHSHPKGGMPSSTDMRMLGSVGAFYGISEGVLFSFPQIDRPGAIWTYGEEGVREVQYVQG